MKAPAFIGMITCALLALAGVAEASYPVSGRWTYEDARAPGPAKDCRGDHMIFEGERRLDTGTSVPEYRNVSVARAGAGIYRIVDQFFNVQARGRVSFTLRIVDPDHIEIRYELGKGALLRRCA